MVATEIDFGSQFWVEKGSRGCVAYDTVVYAYLAYNVNIILALATENLHKRMETEMSISYPECAAQSCAAKVTYCVWEQSTLDA